MIEIDLLGVLFYTTFYLNCIVCPYFFGSLWKFAPKGTFFTNLTLFFRSGTGIKANLAIEISQKFVLFLEVNSHNFLSIEVTTFHANGNDSDNNGPATPLLNLRSHKKRISFERRINSESNPEAREMLYRPVLCQFQMFYRLWNLCQLPSFPLRSKFILLINLASLTRTVFFRPTVSAYTLSLHIFMIVAQNHLIYFFL